MRIGSLLLALALAPAAAWPHQCRSPERMAGPKDPVQGQRYFDRTLTPLPAVDESYLESLAAAYPACPDRKHVLDGAGGDCLSNEQVRQLLGAGRRERLAWALAALDRLGASYQGKRQAGIKPAWSLAEAQSALRLLRDNRDVLPDDVVGRFGAWVEEDGHGRFKAPALPSADSMRKAAFFNEDLGAAYAHAGAGFDQAALRPGATPPAVGGPAGEAGYRRDLLAAIDAATWLDPRTKQPRGYDAQTKRLLRLIVEHAEPRDAQNAVAALARYHPDVRAEAELLPPLAAGLTKPTGTPGSETYEVLYNPGVLGRFRLALKDIDAMNAALAGAPAAAAERARAAFLRLQDAQDDNSVARAARAQYRKQLEAALAWAPAQTRAKALEVFDRTQVQAFMFRAKPGQYERVLGVAPLLEAYVGNAPRRSLPFDGMTADVYRDATLYRFSDYELAGTLLHELLHVHTRESRAGGSVPVNEEASRLPQNRMYFNVARRLGKRPEEFLSPGHRPLFLMWRDQPEEYRREIARLMQDAESYHVEADSLDPEGLRRRLAAELKLPPEEFRRTKVAGYARFVDAEALGLRREVTELYESGLITRERRDRGLATIDQWRADAMGKVPPDDEWRAHIEDVLSRLPRDQRILKDLEIEDLLWRQRQRFSSPPR